MEEKKQWIAVILVLLAIAIIGFFVARAVSLRSNEGPDSSDYEVLDDSDMEDFDEEDYDNGIVFEEESEDAVLDFKPSEKEDFYGSWEATSGNAMYLYGNADITIKENGTWKGNLADEDVSGTWEFDGTTVKLSSDLYNATLSFTKDGKLIMQEDRAQDGTYLNTVMTRKE